MLVPEMPSTRTARAKAARVAWASSRALSPFMRRPMRKLPAWAGLILPSMSEEKPVAAISAVRSSLRARHSSMAVRLAASLSLLKTDCGKLPSRRSPSGVSTDSG